MLLNASQSLIFWSLVLTALYAELSKWHLDTQGGASLVPYLQQGHVSEDELKRWLL